MNKTEEEKKFSKENFVFEFKGDPLLNEEFKYPSTEWDNIPAIVPKFMLTMNQHLINQLL